MMVTVAPVVRVVVGAAVMMLAAGCGGDDGTAVAAVGVAAGE